MLKGSLSSEILGLSRKAAIAACAAVCLLAAPAAHAVTTLKQVQISNGSQIDLLFDGKIQKGQIHTDFINDIIQLSIQDVSVYPAKISSVNGGALTKIFAYQYAPKLVRCRLTVKGKAEDYKDKLEIKAGGRILTVRMQAQVAAAPAPSQPDAEELALLNRVKAAEAPKPAKEAAKLVKEPAKESAKASSEKDAITVSAAAPATVASTDGAPGSSENLPIHLTGESSGKLTGAKPLPSPLKAFGKMGLVLGLFGLFAFGLKRYAQSKADSRLGDSRVLENAASEGGWLGALGRIAKKGLGRNQRMIEVLSSHYLGPKKSISVVRVAGRVLVLGVSNESINLITQLSEEDAADQLGSLDALDLGALVTPSKSAPLKSKTAAAAAAAGATAAGNPFFADLLQTERSKPAFTNPSGPSAYAAGPAVSQPAKNGGANVRAQIRNRLEGLKQL